MASYAIIGGGLLGMTFAHRFAQLGHEVSLFEADDNLGGLSSPWQINDITWDKFYHVLLLSDIHIRSLLQEINLDKEIVWKQTKTGFFVDKKFYSMSNSIEFLKFPFISLIDKFRLGLTIFYASKITNWHKLEEITVESWLRKWSGKNTFEKVWKPLLKAKLGEEYKNTSAAFIWTTIQRMYAARKGGMKTEMFGYVPGGYSTILKSLKTTLEAENVNIFTNHSAQNISEIQDGVEIKFTNGTVKKFDNTVITVPSNIALKICGSISNETKESMAKTKYLGVVCASVLLNENIEDYYVTNIIDEKIPFTGLINMSALVDEKEFKGKTLIYLPKYVNSNDDSFSQTDEELIHKFKGALLYMFPKLKTENIIDIKIAKAKEVFALPVLNYSKNLSNNNDINSKISIINSSHILNGTLNNNEIIKLVNSTIEKLK